MAKERGGGGNVAVSPHTHLQSQSAIASHAAQSSLFQVLPGKARGHLPKISPIWRSILVEN